MADEAPQLAQQKRQPMDPVHILGIAAPAAEAQFGSPSCTCVPWTRQGGTPRYCGPTDTVDMIGGWERGRDCPHHSQSALAPADRATVYRELADRQTQLAVADDLQRERGMATARRRLAAELRRMADEAQQPTPCSVPDACEDGELCGVHEVEQAHADGEHEYCGVTCEAQFPTEQLRNTVLLRAIPGAAGMLDELLRRVGAPQSTAGRSCGVLRAGPRRHLPECPIRDAETTKES